MVTGHNGMTRNGKMAWCTDCDAWIMQDHWFWKYSSTVWMHQNGRGHKVKWIAVDFTQGWEVVGDLNFCQTAE